MVDVSGKAPTARLAVAVGRVEISRALGRAIRANTLAKGNLLETARLAGIMAAKRCAELIPLCHNLTLEHIDIRTRLTATAVQLRAEVRTLGRTGAEMEALTAVAVAALTVIDMGKACDPFMVANDIHLLEKGGGRHGIVRFHEKRRG